MKDRLYLLKPNFPDKGTGPFFCPGCARVEGMLSYYPALREKLEIVYIDFQRPRPALVSELGEEHQGCPKLILGDPGRPIPADVTVSQAKGHQFISDDIEICRYMAKTYGVGEPH